MSCSFWIRRKKRAASKYKQEQAELLKNEQEVKAEVTEPEKPKKAGGKNGKFDK